MFEFFSSEARMEREIKRREREQQRRWEKTDKHISTVYPSTERQQPANPWERFARNPDASCLEGLLTDEKLWGGNPPKYILEARAIEAAKG